ncbi:NAD binding Rossmann fold oxidoreductase [Aspergillus homomorphus CBS 101889]|uniref:NAD binding Rossmann fold oxidoreductase n=1 Tax=Aspergillus homomorphus (strain CBS 101889) TaxID=1450537 RepID=A0A395I0B8_ASPHC|nr:NAD binding Rossmann fold oxidoreductase [Aspergillus homomorphus CBS 101889]RAL13073.1 NAD binding Rossmann fold oxidoreductase [Aspergillus homomorphus CBS 101889]
MSSSTVWKVGIVGYGFSAKIFHIPFIQRSSNFRLHAVVQRNPSPGNDVTVDFPGVVSYQSAEDMVQDSTIDVIVITTPPNTHFHLTKLALDAGKHVVCEKPFTPTSAEAEELVTLAKNQERVLAVFQNRRWDADFATVSNLIESGTLGRIVEFETHYDRYRPEQPTNGSWKNQVMAGHGAIYDLGIHLLDQAVQLFGLPARVTGVVGSQREHTPAGLEDAFTVLLHYPGLLVTAKSTVVSAEEDQLRFWVRGDKGSYKKFHVDIQEEQLLAGMRPGDSGFAEEPSERFGTLVTVKDGRPSKSAFPTDKPPTYVAFYQTLADALAGACRPAASGEEARNTIRIIELARESSTLGRTLDF